MDHCQRLGLVGPFTSQKTMSLLRVRLEAGEAMVRRFTGMTETLMMGVCAYRVIYYMEMNSLWLQMYSGKWVLQLTAGRLIILSVHRSERAVLLGLD